ncbi:hypothetical protein ColLi_05726 [Colletotrichum liriopes]|uniref:Uncharacterized protein n=1 Tax=Colletotrichum liriopes TaxID=708192 RepID=A0AA37LT00_9PEZI|nr:hypothetical protein ColLi_05726 [Colletotrichum liriopes]
MLLAASAALFSTFLSSVVSGLALPWFNVDPATAIGEEERRNFEFPKEMDLMEELVRRAERYCPGAHGEDKNECYWKLRGHGRGTRTTTHPPLCECSDLSAPRSDGGVLDGGDGRLTCEEERVKVVCQRFFTAGDWCQPSTRLW